MIYQKHPQYNSDTEGSDIPNTDNTEESINLQQYEEQRSHYLQAKFQPALIAQADIESHNITILRSTQQGTSKIGDKQLSTQFFSIIQTQFNGLQYTYEAIIGPFRLKVLVLNLLREADSGGDDYNVQELGVGTFGTVSEIKLKEGSSFATKRIPFRYKLNPDEGYDYEENKAEEVQLKRCLKQFCFYKIFSLLNVGPKVISSGYDLICFNNCVEFKMELCEPLNNQFLDRGIEMQQCTKDLCSRLFMLHSMSLVHRDIKPENILYSPSQKQFVLGDFGMVTMINEGYRQKTTTRFMGTPNYCGQEMKALLNGGFGNVNLYLNDFHALKLALSFLNSNFIGQSSKITSNSLSFNQYQTSFFGSSSFTPYESSNNNSGEQACTDQSPNPTRNSLATLPTTCTLAPKKYASLINYFQSQTIHQICRAMQRKVYVPKDTINDFIMATYPEHENQQILTNLYIEVADIFQTDDPVKQLIKQWRHSSRHYGPQHYLTIKILQEIVARVDQTTAAAIKDIERKILQARGHLRPDKMELSMHRQLRNIRGFIYSLIATLRSSIRLKNYPIQTAEEFNEQAIELAEYYIEGIYTILPYCGQALTLTNLTLKYFSLPEPSNQPNGTKVDSTMTFCYEFLKDRGRCTMRNTYMYLTYLLEDIKGVNWSYREHLVIDGIDMIVKSIEQSTADEKVTFINLVLLMANYRQFYNSEIDMPKLLDLAQTITQNLIEKQNELNDKKWLLRLSKAYLLYLSDRYLAAIQQCKHSLSYFHAQNLRHSATEQFTRIEVLNLIASIYIKITNYQAAAEHLKQALSLVESSSGSLYRPKHVYNILSNMIVIKHREGLYPQALEQAEQLIQFLLKADFPKKQIKIISCYHLCISLTFLIGITADRKERVKHYLNQMLVTLYGFMGQSSIWAELSSFFGDLYAGGVGHLQLADTFFLYQQLIALFTARKQYTRFFCYQNAAAHYELAKYYIRDLRQHLKGIKYLWNYLRIILNDQCPSKLRQIDYQIVYIYAKCLVKNQFNRHAIRFLIKFLKYIPELYSEVKLKCLQLMHKAMESVASPRLKLYSELTKNKCKKVRQKNFRSVMRSIARNRLQEKLYGRQLKGLFLVDIEEEERPSDLGEGDQV